MNFNIGGPSNFLSSSSSSSSDDEEDQIIANLEAIDAKQKVLLAQHGNIQRVIAQYLNQQNNPVIRGGSIPGHIVINRDRKSADRRLFYDYFAENPRYNDQMLCRRFRMDRSLFLRIVEKVKARDNYFVQRRNSVGRLGMLGNLDYMHWKWKNCPTAWAGQYASRSGFPTIILEAVADYDLWIWHAYFGLSGTNNDINVLEASHLFANLAQGIAPPAHYVIQGKKNII
ncbi:hypothetical protein Dsin_024259 [Dipteronia sinensis]|uniref:Uncharacterized protein n=1 Tax=Dipteronia sinensis TaxID=43782 RepID=A0AAE0DX82_9ROSI|nr:hypothetical protein Dsin_024259 [Dipteronia sinensis]